MTFDIGAEPGSPSRALREPGLSQRIAITLGAMLVAQLGTFIPLPGINPETVANLLNQSSSHLATLAWSHLSVFGLGMTPIFSALILAEVLMLINSSKRRLPVDLATREAFNRGILVAGLFFAALQAWGISLGLEGVPRTVDEPGFIFRTSCIVSMVAATAFLSWLASLITRHGLGSGFWFLLLVPSLVGTIKSAMSMKSAADMGALPSDLLILSLALFAALSVALVALERANPGLAQSGSTIWPLVLAATCASWLVIPALVYINPNEMNGSISKLQPRHYVTFAAFAFLVPIFSLWRMRSLKDANTGAAAVNTPLIIAGVLTAIMILTEYMIAKIGFYDLPVGEDQVTAVAVALCALQAIRASKARPAPL